MNRARVSLATIAVALLAFLPDPGFAQGVTTGAISGTITNEQGQGVEAAQVQVVNRSNGSRTGTVTRSDGRFYIQGLEVGGPYTISVRRIGFTPRDTSNVYVSLGQNARVDLNLASQATQIAAVQVTGASTAIINSAHKGVTTTITDSAIARMPTLNRNFTDFVALTPQISTKGPGNSGGGQNNRFNAIQIDGSVANDLFGLGSTGQPGGQANAKQISLEAVKEYQVLLSPFDVRQGNFTGALVNAVTKTGSNEFHGTATFANRTEKLERNVDYLRAAPFTQKQEGFWVGGPVIKDRLLFSIAPEWQQQNQPASGPYVGQPAGVTPRAAATAAGVDSLVNILKNQYGFADPGTGGIVKNENPLSNVFARFDLINLPASSRLVARYNYVNGQQDILSRSPTVLSLSNNGYNFRSVTNSYLAQLFSNFNNSTSNEFLVGLTRIRDARITPITAPFVRISRTTNEASNGTGAMTAGTENSSQGNELDQDIFEITDNYTVPVGNHRFTIGTKNEFFKVRNLFAQNSFGNFTFGTLDSLIANRPSSATLGIKLGNGDGNARFNARTLGFYAEDEWQTTTNLSTTFGLRLDIPGLTSRPSLNPDIQSALGINTTEVPQSVKQWSPRFGFNWDVTGDARNQVRGGSGVFVGRPAYVWLSNLFGNSGVDGYGNLVCNGLNAPQMPQAGQPAPTNCVNAGAPSITVNTVDPNLKFPSVWRSSLGYDRVLPWNVIGTFEAMYTRAVAAFYYQNIGIVADPIGTDRNGRALYGEITTAGATPTPARRPIPGTTPQRFLGDVIALSNTKTKDYSYSYTWQLQKRFSNDFEGSFAYTYGRSYDVWDLTSSVAFSNWSFGRSYSGRQDAQDLAPSKWDVPHRFVAGFSKTFPSKTDISGTFFAESGVPFEYVYNGDVNGDNSTANDLIYVPKDAHDPNEILFSQNGNLSPANQADSLEAFISRNECLNSQRGHIMTRNSCRSPWTKVMNVSVRQSLPTLRGQNFMLQLDIFNFLNLLNRNWGAQDIGSTNSPQLLSRRSWVAAPGQPLKLASGAQGVFNFTPFQQFNTRNASSNYALQLQLKYSF
ncbi:MAG TPA: carboxypeptidase regulatory-like domain-containing protein [Gemmatimonadaceae bacterium]|nr:carboxypeptidase regulatory-like domain-containing protein [Gemmatimonadaceae bacterium]